MNDSYCINAKKMIIKPKYYPNTHFYSGSAGRTTGHGIILTNLEILGYFLSFNTLHILWHLLSAELKTPSYSALVSELMYTKIDNRYSLARYMIKVGLCYERLRVYLHV